MMTASRMAKTVLVRLSDEEFERLERIVTWINAADEWPETTKRKELVNYSGWGRVTVSDVLRFLINGNQVDVIHSRIRKRNTKPAVPAAPRNTRRRRATR